MIDSDRMGRASYNEIARAALAIVAVLVGIAHAEAPHFDSPSVAILDARTHQKLLGLPWES